MVEDGSRLRLGRGLASLIGEADEGRSDDRPRGQRRVPIEFLRPNPRNPRKRFAEGDLDDLATSIAQRGIVQPIVVRPISEVPDVYEIVAGERRWRAAQRAGLHEVPIAVVEVDDRTSLEYAILENVQRSDLNAIEEAAGYDRLMKEFGYTQAELAQILGKSRSHLANTLRLLNLPAALRDMLVEGQISPGHARALLSVEEPESLARRIVSDGLTVRDAERLAQAATEARSPTEPDGTRRPRSKPEKDPDTRALERALEEVLGLKVSIEHRAGGGEVRIRYTTLEQLDALCGRLRDRV